MTLPRRSFLHLAASAAAVPAMSRGASAQAFPARPVRIIVGYAAGGGTDISARVIGQWLSERLGQQFIIENRPGGATNVATEAVARSAPDDYTLLLATAASAINASTTTSSTSISSRTPRRSPPSCGAAGHGRDPVASVKSVPELIAYAKANARSTTRPAAPWT
jgi:tripartite-type tricarboxylate transporter receptor subunit TctC